MGRLLLIRHGESVWNREGIVQGQDGPGLSPLGHEQARRVGAWLATEAPGAAVVSSDLPRCVETAAPFVADVGATLVTDPDLRERHFGDWQGVPRETLRDRHPAMWDRFARQEDVVPAVGGESTPQLLDRVLPALRRAAAAAPTTVVFTHGGPVWHGTHALLGIPERVLGPVGNTAVTELDLDGDERVRLLGWNAMGHLPPRQRTTWRRPRRTAVAPRATGASRPTADGGGRRRPRAPESVDGIT